jgi:hypothetical protein
MRIRVEACAVCRTDLHVIDGDLPHIRHPIVPGHEIVGIVDALGAGSGAWKIGQRVGVPWLGKACGHCEYCLANRENLCDTPTFTGYDRDGGFATQVVADAAFANPDVGICRSDCSGTSAVRRLDRLAVAGRCGSGQDDRPVRVWRRRPRDCTGVPLAGPQGVRVHSRGRSGGTGVCAHARRRVGRRLARRAARALGCGDYICARRRVGSRRTESGQKGRKSGVRRHSHERHTVDSVPHPVGRTSTGLGGQSHTA